MWAVDDECLPTEIVPSIHPERRTLFINEHCSITPLWVQSSQQPAQITAGWQVRTTLSASDNCRFLIIYSPENENFFCLEPVTHCTDAFNKYQAGEADTGIQILEPNAMLKTEMQIDVSAL